MVTEIELFETPDIIPLDFCFWGRMKGIVYIIEVNTRYELLARILDAAARMKKHEDQLPWSSHTSCKVHWCWRWELLTFAVNCTKFVISKLNKN